MHWVVIILTVYYLLHPVLTRKKERASCSFFRAGAEPGTLAVFFAVIAIHQLPLFSGSVFGTNPVFPNTVTSWLVVKKDLLRESSSTKRGPGSSVNIQNSVCFPVRDP
jgi:hypothetical protein